MLVVDGPPICYCFCGKITGLKITFDAWFEEWSGGGNL